VIYGSTLLRIVKMRDSIARVIGRRSRPTCDARSVLRVSAAFAVSASTLYCRDSVSGHDASAMR
jgi:hypothetical protein